MAPLRTRALRSRALAKLLAWLPYRAFYGLADLLGWAILVFTRRGRKTQANVERVFAGKRSEEEIARIVRKALTNRVKQRLEFLLFPVLTSRRFARMAEIAGLEHVNHALGRGRGLLVCGFHLGNVNLAQAALAQAGYHFHVLRASRDLAREPVFYSRGVVTGKILSIEDGRGILEVLNRGEVLAFLVDGLKGGQFLEAPFLGIKLPFATPLIRHAVRHRIPIVPLLTPRLDDNRVRITFLPEVPIPEGENLDAAIEEVLLTVLRPFEEALERDPGQWLRWLDLERRLSMTDRRDEMIS